MSKPKPDGLFRGYSPNLRLHFHFPLTHDAGPVINRADLFMNTTRWLASFLVCATLLGGAGCAWLKPKSKTKGSAEPASAATTNKTPSKPIVTPLAGAIGRVASVNAQGRFLVANYPAGDLPAVDQKLSVYRGALKVGEVKVSKERMGLNVVADIVAGEAKVGDEVRTD